MVDQKRVRVFGKKMHMGKEKGKNITIQQRETERPIGRLWEIVKRKKEEKENMIFSFGF